MSLLPSRFYLDNVFDDLIPTTKSSMKCDIYESGENYHIDIDVPGFDKNDIKIEVDNGYLTISASKTNEESDDRNYIRKERIYETCERSFYIGDLDISDIKANFKDGMLKIVVPKKEVESSKKIIEID